MRRLAIVLVLAGALAACGHEITAPGTPQPQGSDLNAATTAGAGRFGSFGRARFAGAPYVALLRRLPPDMALTDQQKQSIKGYVQAFAQATKSDRQALAALFKQARAAKQSGQTPDQVKAILQQGATNRQHIQAAAAELKQQIEGVLTADQKTWLAANAPTPCDRSAAPKLTDEQKAQIKALVTAFRTANQSDLDAVRAAMRQAREARKNGASKDQIRSILEGVKLNLERLRPARAELRTQIQAVLTPEQKASGCYGPRFGAGRMGPGGFPGGFMGGRRG